MIVGLTGGIGSGKSAAGDFFIELGIDLIDADMISKDIFKNFEDEIKNFVQVCPIEMVNKLKNPISLKPKIKEVS